MDQGCFLDGWGHAGDGTDRHVSGPLR